MFVTNLSIMKLLLILPVVLVTLSISAQVTISGKLTDNKNNPLPGASISIKNSYDGTTTDSLGNYLINTSEKGAQVLEASISGYNTYEKNILLEGKNIAVNISVKELITELKAVILSAGSFEASDQKRTTVLNCL